MSSIPIEPKKNIINWEMFTGFVAGVASGCTKLCVGHPFDTIKVRIQTEGAHGRFSGPLDCLKSTLRAEGFRALYKGATPPLVGWAVMDSVMLGTLTNLKILMSKNGTGRDLHYYQHGIAGWGAGWAVCFVSTPIELIKSQLQVQYDRSSTRYTGPIDCALKIYKSHGVLGLYRGFQANLIFRSLFAILWSGYEFYSRLFTAWKISPTFVPFFAGGVAANTFWVIAFPTDVVRARILAQPDTRPLRYPNVITCVKYIYQTEGMRGFYRGFLPCMMRSFPANGAAILAFDLSFKYLNQLSEKLH